MGKKGGFGTRPYGLSVVMVDFWDGLVRDEGRTVAFVRCWFIREDLFPKSPPEAGRGLYFD